MCYKWKRAHPPLALKHKESVIDPASAHTSFMCWTLSPFYFCFDLNYLSFLSFLFICSLCLRGRGSDIFLVPSGSCTACLCWLSSACSSALLLFRGTVWGGGGGGAPFPLSTPATMIKNLGPLAHWLPLQTKERMKKKTLFTDCNPALRLMLV